MSRLVAAKCPECGGALEQVDARHCGYCGSVLVRESPEQQPQVDAWDVSLDGVNDGQLVAAIKAVRQVTGLTMYDCKDLIEASPSIIACGRDRDAAENIAATLREAGGVVSLKPCTGADQSSHFLGGKDPATLGEDEDDPSRKAYRQTLALIDKFEKSD